MIKLEYEKVVEAKEKVGNINFTEITSNELVSFISELSLEEKAVIACGCFVEDLRWGISFQMPSTHDVMDYDLERLESNDRTDCVEYDISVSEIQATDAGFYVEESNKHIYTGRYK